MMHRSSLALASLALAALVQPNPAAAASPFDGVYHGSVDMTANPRRVRNCPQQRDFVAKVVDGAFVFRWDSVLDVKLEADGSFSASNGGTTLKGRLAGTTMDAYLTGPACTYRVTATK